MAFMASHVSSTIVSKFTQKVDSEYHVTTLSLSSTGKMYMIEFDAKNKKDFIPKKIQLLKNITAFDCGVDHIVCLDDSSCVFTLGSNECGQLGNNRESLVSTLQPQKVDLPPISNVSCGAYFTICVSTEGEVYSFGNGRNGVLGLGGQQKYCSPQKIESLKNVNFATCGPDFCICLSDDDELFCWGNNSEGQLGISNGKIFLTPTKCVNKPDNIVDIKCGEKHTLLLTLIQEVYSCGYNEEGNWGEKLMMITHLP